MFAAGFLMLMSWVVMSAQTPPSLTAEEKAAGWRLLFDGTSLAGWRSYKTETPPSGWRVSGGELIRDGAGADLMTSEQFGDFELRLDWKISKNGNSGVIYRATTEGPYPWSTGPEFQVLDNAGHADGKNPLTSAGSNYAVNPPRMDVTKPVGEWNSILLIVKGNHVEHWMNGQKLVAYDIGSPDWERRVKASKFGKMPGYGLAKRGYIVLQDHESVVSYRNIRIRQL
jgi:3-keto-disaccharide hydrolase